MELIETALGILIYYLAFMISIFIHELGHLVGYRIARKDNDWTIQLGTGKVLFSIKWLKVNLFPISGLFEYKKTLKGKRENLLMTSGGPIFTTTFIILLFVLLNIIKTNVSGCIDSFKMLLNKMLYYNLWMLFFTLMPIKYPVFVSMFEKSDGLVILNLLRNKQR